MYRKGIASHVVPNLRDPAVVAVMVLDNHTMMPGHAVQPTPTPSCAALLALSVLP